ncbi:stalk domain-containing protein [Paenibacillus koleovorans]|uniref:stalk domain-containing protein n=1 Tax=Paenibacillus koleovorans TaxID=121608 RepID=UPI0013E2F8E6|nr:stalk domain-containing protein [Paenibacillus koleovorans]
MKTSKKLCSWLFLISILWITLLSISVSAEGETELPLFNTLSMDIGGWSKFAVSPDGKLLFSGGGERSYLWHLDSGRNKEIKELGRYDLDGSVEDAVFSPDGKLLAIAISGNSMNRVMLVDSQSGSLSDIIETSTSGFVGPIQFSHDGKFLITGLRWDRISVIDLASHKEVYGFPKAEYINLIRTNPSRNEFAVTSSHTKDRNLKDLQIRNTSTGEIIKSLGSTLPPGNCGISDMSYSPDGKYFIVSSYENCGTLVYDADKTYEQIAVLDHYGSISFSKDSSLAVIGNRVYPIEDKFKNSYGLKVKHSDQQIDSKLAFLTPDGKYFITRYNPHTSNGLIVLDASDLSVRLTGIRIEPESIALGLNESQALKATGLYSDETSKLLNADAVKWTVKDFYMAEVKENVLYGLTYGSTALTAEYGGHKATTPITIADRPSGLKAFLDGNQVKLSWSGVNNTAGLMGYYLYRRTTDSSYGAMPLTDFPLQTTDYTDSNVNSNLQYYYIVKTVYSNIESGPSNETSPAPKTIQIVLQIDNPTMQVNGNSKEIDPGNGTAPVIYLGRTVLPIRALIEELGGQLIWEDLDRRIAIDLKGMKIELWIDKNKAIVNDNELTLDVAPTIINGRTMLPLRFIADHLGLHLTWDGTTQRVELIG